MKGHTDWVRCVAFSPDGASLGDRRRRQHRKGLDGGGRFSCSTLTGHAYHVWGVGFTPDNRRIATGSTDNTARIWDAATGAELLTFSEAKFERWQTYSPDGKARLQSVHIEDLHCAGSPASDARVVRRRTEAVRDGGGFPSWRNGDRLTAEDDARGIRVILRHMATHTSFRAYVELMPVCCITRPRREINSLH